MSPTGPAALVRDEEPVSVMRRQRVYCAELLGDPEHARTTPANGTFVPDARRTACGDRKCGARPVGRSACRAWRRRDGGPD